MKRSDMVNLISYYGLPIEILAKAGIDDIQLANNILKIIEEQGMLPPFEDDPQAGINNKNYVTLHIYQAVYAGTCKWDDVPETVEEEP